MNLMIFIVSPIVGSIIGYFTNWVAIKMLFRPLAEKRILGIKVPFTPGVIPRRRGKLAESIGDTVGRQLLTADAFHDILQGEEMKSKLSQFIKERLESLEQEERSIEQIMEGVIVEAEKREALAERIKGLFLKAIKSLLNEESIVKLLEQQLQDLDTQDLALYFESEGYQQLKADLEIFILDYLHSDSTKEQLINLIEEAVTYLEKSEQTLEDILPDSIQQGLRQWLAEQGPQLVEELINFLGSEQTKGRIKHKIEEFLENNPLMQMVGGFIDQDKIVEQLMGQMVKFLREPSNQEEIVAQVNQFLESILQTEIATLVAKLDQQALVEISDSLLDSLASKKLCNQFLTSLEAIALEKINEFQLQTEEERVVLSEKIKALLKKILDNETFLASLELWSAEQLRQLGKRPVTTYFKSLDLQTLEQLETTTVSSLVYIVKNHLGKVLSTLDFKKMVEKKVNSFDVLEVEALLLNVIETELKAITWFGAILGLMMGLITPFISLFMS